MANAAAAMRFDAIVALCDIGRPAAIITTTTKVFSKVASTIAAITAACKHTHTVTSNRMSLNLSQLVGMVISTPL